MMVDRVVALVRSQHHRDHKFAQQLSACFFFDLCSRQRLRFSLTSLIPTVIWVGRGERIGIG